MTAPLTEALIRRHAEESTDWMLTADSLARHAKALEVALRAARTRCLLLARERNALKSQISNLQSLIP